LGIGILDTPLVKCNRFKIAPMKQEHRSTCPISTALELVGDRWTLLVIRDLMFADKRHFREFLQSEEAISSNVLADRLNALVQGGIVTKSADPTHAQKAIYSLTEKGLELLPVLVAMSAWTQRHYPKTRRPEARQLVQGGPKLMKTLEEKLLAERVSTRASNVRPIRGRPCRADERRSRQELALRHTAAVDPSGLGSSSTEEVQICPGSS
jgi:DNA-binding HxlR family transcriptional regulator